MTKSQIRFWGIGLALLAVVFLLPLLFVIPAHALNGGADGGTSADVVQGIIDDDMPSDADGVGDTSDFQTFDGTNNFVGVQDASGGTCVWVITSFCDPGDGYTDKDPHPPLIRVRTQYQVWTRDVPLTVGAGAHIQATITTEYYFWHGFVGMTNRVAPFGVDLCYAFKNGASPGVLWQGISADATWFDEARGIEVNNIRTGDKGKGGCEHFAIPRENRRWLIMLQHPAWLAQGWANWGGGVGDQNFHWHTPRVDDSKWLSPAKDPIITTKKGKVWHNIYKTW